MKLEEVSLPICVAGIGVFDTKQGKATVVINVLPYKDYTVVILATNKLYEKPFNEYIEYCTQSPLHLLGMVEAWIVHGTDHWFIKPSVWNALSNENQNSILEDIHDFSKNIGHLYKAGASCFFLEKGS